jgi:hypothetical protein
MLLRICSAELGNGFDQLAPVTYRRHADVLEIIDRQLRQHCPIDFIIAKVGLVSLEAQAPQPRLNVHAVILASEEPQLLLGGR